MPGEVKDRAIPLGHILEKPIHQGAKLGTTNVSISENLDRINRKLEDLNQHVGDIAGVIDTATQRTDRLVVVDANNQSLTLATLARVHP
jgi:hypothetical protein